MKTIDSMKLEIEADGTAKLLDEADRMIGHFGDAETAKKWAKDAGIKLTKKDVEKHEKK